MKENTELADCCDGRMTCKKRGYRGGGDSCAIYGLGVVGALFYFLQGAVGLVAVLMGIGKAIFWPAILMFKLLTYLQI